MVESDLAVKGKRIAALVPNVLGFSPGQRVRIELWEKYLKQAGWTVEFFPFEDDALHEVLYTRGNTFAKAGRMFASYRRHLTRALEKFPGDVIFIYREAALIGPAWLETLAARQNAPVVYDLDDPVFLPYKSPTSGWASLLKFPKKTHRIFKMSSRVIAINGLIGDYARKFNPNVTIVPNCVDVEKYQPRAENDAANRGKNDVRLVWIGSHSTMPNLLEIIEPLKKLQAERRAPLLVIGAGAADLDGVEVEMRQWSAATEVSDLQDGDIGLVPLIKSNWNDWKFFFKTIQYMAVGLPVIAPRIGSNAEVIENGVNGFLVETKREWFERLKLLVENDDLRREMGAHARRTAVERFSAEVQMPRMVEVFEGARTANKVLNK